MSHRDAEQVGVHEGLESMAEARRELAHAALDRVLTVADELARLRFGAAVARQLVEAAEDDDANDTAMLASLARLAEESVDRLRGATDALQALLGELVTSLTSDGLDGPGEAVGRAADAFADAAAAADARRAESTTVLRAVGRLAVGSGATSHDPGEAAADLWDLGLELLALTALEDPADDPHDDDSGHLPMLDERRLLRDLTGLVAEVAVNAPAALALQVGASAGSWPAATTEVTVRHLHDEVVVGVEPAPDGLHAPVLRAEGDALVARLDPDEAPPDVASLVAGVLRGLGVEPGRDLAFLVVRLEPERAGVTR
jgi:hypothetical protein